MPVAQRSDLLQEVDRHMLGDQIPEADANVEPGPVEPVLAPDVGVPQVPVHVPVDEPVLRRSSRLSRAPDRLQVETWKGQTYVPQPVSQQDSTACQSIAYSDYLHPFRPGGGGRASMIVD